MISLVIPAYNEERNLEVLYSSVREVMNTAGENDWELVVVDDGSKDASVGAHLLVSGDDRYIWGCGFTRSYTDQDAALFEAAFSP